MVTLSEGRDTTAINLQFLVVPCKNIYNCIIDIPFTVTLDAMASLPHLKLKYHSIHEKSITICAKLSREKRIYQYFQQDQKKDKGKVMEINIASLVRLLRGMKINPSVVKANYSSWTLEGENSKCKPEPTTTCLTNVPSGQ